MPKVKTVFAGDAGVGKTCIIECAAHGSCKPNTFSTVGAANATVAVRAKTNQKDTMVEFDTWDTADQEKHRSLAPMHFTHLAILVRQTPLRAPRSLIGPFPEVDPPPSMSGVGKKSKLHRSHGNRADQLYVISTDRSKDINRTLRRSGIKLTASYSKSYREMAHPPLTEIISDGDLFEVTLDASKFCSVLKQLNAKIRRQDEQIATLRGLISSEVTHGDFD
jgi:hypothetical protein